MLLLALLEGHSKLIFEPVMVAVLLVIHIAVVKVCFMSGVYLLTEKQCWRSQKIMFSPNFLFLSHCFYLLKAASWPF